jgi:hypothetical protein
MTARWSDPRRLPGSTAPCDPGYARAANRSHSTVKHHLANARSKVGATTTAQLVWILAERLSEPDGEVQADEEMPGPTPHLAAAH